MALGTRIKGAESVRVPVEKRVTFAYGRAFLVGRVGFLTVSLAAFAFALATFPPLPTEPLLLTASVIGAYAVVFVLSPLLTDHWLTRSRLLLRQGWYFRVVVPFSEIASVEASEWSPGRVPLGLHRPLGRSTMYVTGSRSGLVVIRLRSPRRFWQAFGLPADEIVFDVGDPAGFLREIEARRGLLSPVEPERADA